MGKLLTVVLVLSEKVPLPNAILATMIAMVRMPQELFSFFDIIWIVIAILAPIRVFKPVNIDLRGPLDQGSGPPQHLQFDRIEPTPADVPPGGI